MLNLLSSHDLLAVSLTLKLAFTSTIILLAIGIPLAWWLSRSQHFFKSFIETIIALPLILPPTVIGFYLLLAFAPETGLAKIWQLLFNTNLAFSFSGLVIGSIIYSLPFVVQPLQNSFERIPNLTLLTAASLGAKPLDWFCTVVMPMSRRATISAAALAFCHTVGEFGIVLMIGGNIPGETQVLSIALFDHVESLNYANAHTLALILLAFSFVSLLIIYTSGHNRQERLIHVGS